MNEGNSFKAKITTSLGTFEFEGSEDFVEKQVARIIKLEEAAPKVTEAPQETTEKPVPAKGSVSSSKPGKKPSGEQPKMLPNLITGKDKIDSLRSFHDTKKPVNHIETFAVLSYWLKTELQLVDVSIDEMWTIYKVLQLRPPKVLMQTFRDGKSKKAYFDASAKSGRYILTSFGETFVEHDLPKKSPEKKSN